MCKTLSLERQAQCELELARVERGSGTACVAVEWTDIQNVEAIEQVEAIGDDLELEAFAEREITREAKIDKNNVWLDACVTPEIAIEVAAADCRVGRRVDIAGQVKRTQRRKPGYDRRTPAACRAAGGGDGVGAVGQRIEIEIGVLAREDIKRSAGRDLDDRSDSEVPARGPRPHRYAGCRCGTRRSAQSDGAGRRQTRRVRRWR